MFTVFYDGKFVDWWHNPREDKDWVQRTIRAMGWNPLLVFVVWFDVRPEGMFKFSEDCLSLTTVKKEIIQIEVNDEMVDQTVYSDDQTWEGTKWYENGAMIQS